eukprot:TRINITY_DN60019_c0_g1_i1.p1 TRINITY_DN60019_c0_g1~~TRINITY_DN60019_c0_g1_i1.p1  ORF type:complete len:228 (-),score=59.85 TRINITY_DN60019_c0_g1_i1:287-898(-)
MLRSLVGSEMCIRDRLMVSTSGTSAADMFGTAWPLLRSRSAQLVDCTVWLQDMAMADSVRQWLRAHSPTMPSVTIVRAGVSGTMSAQCAASTHPITPIHAPAESAYAVRANGLVWVSGISGLLANGTDTLHVLKRTLANVGVPMRSVVNCIFYVKHQSIISELFEGFYQVFNLEHPPPPSRTEFQATSECTECQVLTKCIAVA